MKADTKKCERCGKEFVIKFPHNINKFCGRSCVNESRNGSIPKTCVVCGAAFTLFKSGDPRRVTCSGTCYKVIKCKPVMERFWKYVIRADNNCWEWIGATNEYGHGLLTITGKTVMAHRLSYEYHIGPIPHKMWVLHNCDTAGCTNPNHLYLGNRVKNVVDMLNRKRQAFGERNHAAKLTDKIVSDIRKSKLTNKQLAVRYSVTDQTIAKARSGKTWKHLPIS